MKLRKYDNKDGVPVELLSLKLSYEYEGLIEGSRSGAHEAIRKRIYAELQLNNALYVVGFSEQDEEVEKRWSNRNEWPPSELVEVRCRSSWVPNGKHPHGHTYLEIKWYQDNGDPFDFLSKILNRISWKKYSTYVDLVD